MVSASCGSRKLEKRSSLSDLDWVRRSGPPDPLVAFIISACALSLVKPSVSFFSIAGNAMMISKAPRNPSAKSGPSGPSASVSIVLTVSSIVAP